VKSESQIRCALREWVVQASGQIAAEDVDDETPIIERRILRSAQVMDLILYLEELRGGSIDVEQLAAGAFRSIDAIYARFFEEVSDAQ
jgi:acyl carrier protein